MILINIRLYNPALCFHQLAIVLDEKTYNWLAGSPAQPSCISRIHYSCNIIQTMLRLVHCNLLPASNRQSWQVLVCTDLIDRATPCNSLRLIGTDTQDKCQVRKRQLEKCLFSLCSHYVLTPL